MIAAHISSTRWQPALAAIHPKRRPDGALPYREGRNFGSVTAPNITPDRATGIGNWTDGQIANTIRFGIRPDGSRIGPPMPQLAYRGMTDADLNAIITYLRSIPAVSHLVPQSASAVLPPIAREASMPHLATPNDLVGQGRYIATALSHCTECHTPAPLSASNAAAHLNEGGRLFNTPQGAIVAPAIRKADLKRFTDNELVAIITKGAQPDGRKIAGPMPVKSYAHLRTADVNALIAFLRSEQSR